MAPRKVWLGIALAGLLTSSPLSAQVPKPRAILRGHTDTVGALAFGPDGKALASGSVDGSVKLWDVATGKNTVTLKAGGSRSVAFSPDGKTLASGGPAGSIKLWNLAKGESTALARGDSHGVPNVVFSPDGKLLASGGECVFGTKLWEVATGKNAPTLDGHENDFDIAVAFTPDGKALASVGMEGGIRWWDVVTGKEKKPVPSAADKARIEKLIDTLGHEKAAERDKASRELESLGTLPLAILQGATSRKDAEVRRRAAGLVTRLKARAITAGVVWRAAFSPDGKTLAAVWEPRPADDGRGSRVIFDQELTLWDVSTGKKRAVLKGPETVLALAFSPDGKTLASGDLDGTVKLWDVANGKELAALKEPTDSVLSLAFSPDGKTLASGGEDKTIKLWDVAKAK